MKIRVNNNGDLILTMNGFYLHSYPGENKSIFSFRCMGWELYHSIDTAGVYIFLNIRLENHFRLDTYKVKDGEEITVNWNDRTLLDFTIPKVVKWWRIVLRNAG
jgi:hypothetical protein